MVNPSDQAITARPFGAEGWFMSRNGRRLIEDFLPIQQVSKEASREKSLRKGHISSLHLWWARRPLVACRAAVFGSLVPADFWLEVDSSPADGPSSPPVSPQTLRRMNHKEAGRFLTELCKYPGRRDVLEQGRRYVVEAHAAKLTQELGRPVTVEDIQAGLAPRPRVLDLYAGGGAIPLEALRLGCEAHALELNPVAYLIELCTLVYPQCYGRRDAKAAGTGPGGSWAGLADEVASWGKRVLEQVRREIGDLYPPITTEPGSVRQAGLWGEDASTTRELVPVACIWTRTVRCKNVSCAAVVPLARQTWLCRKGNKQIAARTLAHRGEKQVKYEVVAASTEQGLEFDPGAFSKGGNATCAFCGTVADAKYVQSAGRSGQAGRQLMAVVCSRPGKKGKFYLSPDQLPAGALPEPPQEWWTPS